MVRQSRLARRARGKGDEFRRQQSVGAERRGDVVGQRRHAFVEIDRHPDGIFFVRLGLPLRRAEMLDGDDAAGGRTRITNLGMKFDPGDVFVVDLQSARRFVQSVTRKRHREGSEEDEAANDHGEGDEIIGEVFLHGVFRWRRPRALTSGRGFTCG